ncbi:S8 family serine peptidase [Cohnella sp. CFH 77786]|uniref:S8 family peptidase n=1 Tax=Cohnella sp. CFH 77786 TaxID=2662265 RepID=UPI001C60FFAD|nr:S8 family peptidase [Cohnella sp. CFH 77786]MBW5448694.1 S8 family serine peptidase [Cohnella sp. CFH 77786]
MNACGFLDWLHDSLNAGKHSKRRSILRFASHRDYRQLLHELQTRKRRGDKLRGVRQLGLIRGISCPSPPEAVPRHWGNRIRCEEDGAVRVHALSRGSVALDKGIPWGVRHIQAPDAWSKTTGHNVHVGVIDTGIDFMHPDLQHSIDRGINLIYRTEPPYDDNGHGTHIAGTIAAANRLEGMIGVAPRATIHPVKAFDQNGTAYVSDIILGLDWCVRNRMHIVNMSFGMQTRSNSLLQAVMNANQAGVIVVASSGNDGRSSEIDYPARYGHTIAVGATTEQGRVAPFTNRGPIDIYAPGDKIVSAWLDGKYREMSGTSMATSHVSGAIALLIAYRPGLSPAQIKEIVKQSAKTLRGSNAPRAAGELNVMRMLKAVDRIF